MAESRRPPGLDLDLTEDAFLGGRFTVLQPAKGYRAGIDAVMLAASVPAKPGDHVLEAGIGVGVASFCLAGRVPDLALTGIELQTELVAIARANAGRLAGFAHLKVHEADVLRPLGEFERAGLAPGSFDHVFANPPYYQTEASDLSPHAIKARAHAQDGGTLDDWVRFCAGMVRPKGTVTFVHKADALGGLVTSMASRLGELTLFPLWPASGQPASRILVRGRKGSKAPSRLLPGLLLHGDGNGFTPEAEQVLRQGAALTLE